METTDHASDETQSHARELRAALQRLHEREEALAHLSAELDETNRGVLALYAELDQRAEYLGRANDLKARFLSNLSHEFRTPLNSVLALSGLLLEHADGPLTPEQERQVTLIRRSAEDLRELVNDLLDLAKVESGKVSVRCTTFRVDSLFATLRGMLRPLLTDGRVTLVFNDSSGVPQLETDEGKLSQILRNLISNALKFTPTGEVRVTAAAEGADVVFAVSDTGIGIAPPDLERIFEDFVQLDHPLQQRARGTGLGLPLSRRLAELLGGTLTVESEPGRGSTFRARIPARYPAACDEGALFAPPAQGALHDRRVLVIEDDPADRERVAAALTAHGCIVLKADAAEPGLRRARAERPDAVVLDLGLPDLTGFELIERLRAEPHTAGIPAVVCSAKRLSAAERHWLADRNVPAVAKNRLAEQLAQGVAQAITRPEPRAGRPST